MVCLEFNGLCYKEFWIYFNARSFEGRERTILDLKKLLFFSFFLKSLFDWISSLDYISFTSLSAFRFHLSL